jgi:hypothetical protein
LTDIQTKIQKPICRGQERKVVFPILAMAGSPKTMSWSARVSDFLAQFLYQPGDTLLHFLSTVIVKNFDIAIGSKYLEDQNLI